MSVLNGLKICECGCKQESPNRVPSFRLEWVFAPMTFNASSRFGGTQWTLEPPHPTSPSADPEHYDVNLPLGASSASQSYPSPAVTDAYHRQLEAAGWIAGASENRSNVWPNNWCEVTGLGPLTGNNSQFGQPPLALHARLTTGPGQHLDGAYPYNFNSFNTIISGRLSGSGTNTITGIGTRFISEQVFPWLLVNGKVHRVASVQSETELTTQDVTGTFSNEPGYVAGVWPWSDVRIRSSVAYQLGMDLWLNNWNGSGPIIRGASAANYISPSTDPNNYTVPVNRFVQRVQPLPTFDTSKHRFECVVSDSGNGSIAFGSAAFSLNYGNMATEATSGSAKVIGQAGGRDVSALIIIPMAPRRFGGRNNGWGGQSVFPNGYQITGSLYVPNTTYGYWGQPSFSGVRLQVSGNPFNGQATQYYAFPQTWDGVSDAVCHPVTCTFVDSNTQQWGVTGNIEAALNPAFPSSIVVRRLG